MLNIFAYNFFAIVVILPVKQAAEIPSRSKENIVVV